MLPGLHTCIGLCCARCKSGFEEGLKAIVGIENMCSMYDLSYYSVQHMQWCVLMHSRVVLLLVYTCACRQYCCGGATCTYPVAVPPNSLSPTAAAVAAAAAAQPYFRELYEGASVMASLPENQLQSNGLPVYNTDEDGSLGAMPVGRIVVGNRRRRRRWDDWQNGNGDDQWNSGGNDWGSGSSSGGGWGSGSSSGGWGSGSSSWGGSSGSSSWGGGSSSWGGGSSGWGGTKSAGRGAAISGGGAAGDQAGTGGSVAVSSVIPQAWWGRLGPPTDLSVCSAYPRNSATIPGTLTANTPWLVSYWADSTNDGCQYTTSSFLITGCTGSQIAPNLILTAAHCVDAGLKQRSTSSDFVNCQNIQLVGMEACYDYDRVPGGDFRCTDPVDAIGVSFYPQNTTGSPFDYAIVFIGPADARQGPFYQVGAKRCAASVRKHHIITTAVTQVLGAAPYRHGWGVAGAQHVGGLGTCSSRDKSFAVFLHQGPRVWHTCTMALHTHIARKRPLLGYVYAGEHSVTLLFCLVYCL